MFDLVVSPMERRFLSRRLHYRPGLPIMNGELRNELEMFAEKMRWKLSISDTSQQEDDIDVLDDLQQDKQPVHPLFTACQSLYWQCNKHGLATRLTYY